MMKTEWREIRGYEGKYQLSNDGKVRTASKKQKKTVKDAKGKEMVVLESEEGSVAYYIDELVQDIFELPVEAEFDSSDVCVYERTIEDLVSQNNQLREELAKYKKPRKGKHIVCEETGEEFIGFAEPARKFGITYDKFYNSFYTKKLESAVIEGKTFRIVKSEQEVSE